MLAAELRCIACAFELVDGPDPIESEGRSAFLSAVRAVTDAGAKWLPARRDLHLSTETIAREQLHV